MLCQIRRSLNSIWDQGLLWLVSSCGMPRTPSPSSTKTLSLMQSNLSFTSHRIKMKLSRALVPQLLRKTNLWSRKSLSLSINCQRSETVWNRKTKRKDMLVNKSKNWRQKTQKSKLTLRLCGKTTICPSLRPSSRFRSIWKCKRLVSTTKPRTKRSRCWFDRWCSQGQTHKRTGWTPTRSTHFCATWSTSCSTMSLRKLRMIVWNRTFWTCLRQMITSESSCWAALAR